MSKKTFEQKALEIIEAKGDVKEIAKEKIEDIKIFLEDQIYAISHTEMRLAKKEVAKAKKEMEKITFSVLENGSFVSPTQWNSNVARAEDLLADAEHKLAELKHNLKRFEDLLKLF